MVYNGKPTREWLGCDEYCSPTACHQSIMHTAVIDACEGHDVMTADILNSFIQAELPPAKEGTSDQINMKIAGVLVGLLVDLAPHVYLDYVVFENEEKVLYIDVLRRLYLC
jgi:hypothetical protein